MASPADHKPKPPGPGWFFSGLSQAETFQLGFTLGHIFKQARRHLDFTPNDLLGNHRTGPLVVARHLMIYTIMTKHPGLHQDDVAKLLGMRAGRIHYAFDQTVIRLAYKDKHYLNTQKIFSHET